MAHTMDYTWIAPNAARYTSATSKFPGMTASAGCPSEIENPRGRTGEHRRSIESSTCSRVRRRRVQIRLVVDPLPNGGVVLRTAPKSRLWELRESVLVLA